jgi:hypothetical protein
LFLLGATFLFPFFIFLFPSRLEMPWWKMKVASDTEVALVFGALLFQPVTRFSVPFVERRREREFQRKSDIDQ